MSQSACIICARHPRMFAKKGNALDMRCYVCDQFSNTAYHRERRRESEKENSDHQEAGPHSCEAQGELFDSEAEPKTNIE